MIKLSPSAVLLVLVAGFSTISCKGGFDNHSSDRDTKTEPEIQEQNSGFESDAEKYESPDRVIWQKPDLVIQQLGDVSGKTVADLGAGTGYFSRRLAYKGARVIAIDIDPGAIHWMEEQKARFPAELQDHLIIRKAMPDDPKLMPQEVDMVMLVNTYTYIENRIPYFTRLQQAIRKGGLVLVIDFKKTETPFGPDLSERIDVHQVEQELQQAGYQIVLMDESALEYQYIIKAIRP